MGHRTAFRARLFRVTTATYIILMALPEISRHLSDIGRKKGRRGLISHVRVRRRNMKEMFLWREVFVIGAVLRSRTVAMGDRERAGPFYFGCRHWDGRWHSCLGCARFSLLCCGECIHSQYPHQHSIQLVPAYTFGNWWVTGGFQRTVLRRRLYSPLNRLCSHTLRDPIDVIHHAGDSPCRTEAGLSSRGFDGIMPRKLEYQNKPVFSLARLFTVFFSPDVRAGLRLVPRPNDSRYENAKLTDTQLVSIRSPYLGISLIT